MTYLVGKTPGVQRAMQRAGEGGKRTEYLAFTLAGDTYAVEIAYVAEILKPPPITEVPRAPRDVVGVVSVRGKLVTVIDLRRRFRLPEGPIDRKTRILLTDVGDGEQIGLLVDEVLQVYRLAENEIEPANVLGGDQPAHIAGIGRPSGGTGSKGGGASAAGNVKGAGTDVLILLALRPILES